MNSEVLTLLLKITLKYVAYGKNNSAFNSVLDRQNTAKLCVYAKSLFFRLFNCNPRDWYLHNTILDVSATTAKCIFTVSQSGWGWKEPLEFTWYNYSAQAGSPRARLSRTISRWLWNISRDGDSRTNLGSLCQCSVTLTVKICFLMFRQNLVCFSLHPLLLVLSLGTTDKGLGLLSFHPPSLKVVVHIDSTPFFSPCWTIPAHSSLERCSSPLIHPSGPLLDSWP